MPPQTNAEMGLVLNIEVCEVNGKPAIQLRKIFSQKADIKYLLDSVFSHKKIMAEIKFNNELLAASKLKALGLY